MTERYLGRQVATLGTDAERQRGFAAMWQPIETAPKDGTRVDMWMSRPRHRGEGFRAPDVYWHEKRGKWMCRWRDGNGYSAVDVRYELVAWMPLPEPPTDQPTSEGEA